MNPYVLRELWALVESSQNQRIQNLDDHSLATWLVDQVMGVRILNAGEVDNLSSYVKNRLPLIREIAQH
jgi:hypothetical protein